MPVRLMAEGLMLCESRLNRTIVGEQNAEFLLRKHPMLQDLIQETGQMLSPSFKVGGRVGAFFA